MIVADINEAKAYLGSFLAAVQAGDEVIITDHGRSIARIPSRNGWNGLRHLE